MLNPYPFSTEPWYYSSFSLIPNSSKGPEVIPHIAFPGQLLLIKVGPLISVGPLRLKGRALVVCSEETVFPSLDVNKEVATGSSGIMTEGASLRAVLPHRGQCSRETGGSQSLPQLWGSSYVRQCIFSLRKQFELAFLLIATKDIITDMSFALLLHWLSKGFQLESRFPS